MNRGPVDKDPVDKDPVDRGPLAGEGFVMTIDHEPLPVSGTPQGASLPAVERLAWRDAGSVDEPPGQPFGRRSAVTSDFFYRAGRPEGWDAGDDEGIENADHPAGYGLVGVVVLCLGLAFILPAAVIALSQWRGLADVDPVVTASIGDGVHDRLTVDDLSMVRVYKGGDSVVTVYGEVANKGRSAVMPGEVIIRLRRADGSVAQSWHHRPGGRMLAPGETLRFITSAIDVSGDAKSVSADARAIKQ
ncbi:MAG: hypothetical protein KDJ80_16345 [Nitratireductor sp.]|nr:hypothetical protein [Nitratireductor sp.]